MAGLKDIGQNLTKKFGMSKTQACEVAEEVFHSIEEFVPYSPVTIRNFGTFKVTVQKARTGRNPKTGEPVSVPEKRKLKFKSTGTLTSMTVG